MLVGGVLSVLLKRSSDEEVAGISPSTTGPGTPDPTVDPGAQPALGTTQPALGTTQPGVPDPATAAPEDPPARVEVAAPNPEPELVPEPEPEPPVARRRPPRNPARMTTREPVTARMTPDPAPVDPAPDEDFGTLTLDTVPWSQVSLGNRQLGTTPLIGVRLPAGSHTLTLVNPERGLRERFVVNITAGRTTTRRVGLE